MAAAPSPPAEIWLCSVLRTRGAVQDALFECNCKPNSKNSHIQTACHGTTSGSRRAPATTKHREVCETLLLLLQIRAAQFCKIARAVVVACKPRQPRLTSLQPISESSTTYSFPVHWSRIRGAAGAHRSRIQKLGPQPFSLWPTWGRHQESSDPDDDEGSAYDRLVQKLQKY